MRVRNSCGFTVLEMSICFSIIAILVAISLVVLWPAFEGDHTTQAYDTTVEVLRKYKNQAVAQSRRYIIVPTAPGTLTVQYWGGGTPAPAPVTVYTYTIPTDIKYQVAAGFPTAATAVPDGFGTGATAIQFNACTVLEGGKPCVIFYPDGSAQDDVGNFNNGVIYINTSAYFYGSRAITVEGATGRIRGWRLVNQAGVATWAQQ
jgi:Tfp pilus assembly protein FimT